MKKFLLAAALAVAVLLPTAVQSQAVPPTDTVRKVSVPGAKDWCSAVVVRADVALTARHCLRRGMSVDGANVEFITSAALIGRDIAVLYAPGLKCPCAKIGIRPAVGDFVVAIGFPSETGVQHTVSAKVRAIGSVALLAPYVTDEDFKAGVFVITDHAILEAGDSGGGMFAIQDGEWRLVGVNAIGVPRHPFSDAEQASGATLVEFAERLLPKE